MRRLYSQLIGTTLRGEEGPSFGRVSDLIVDPDTGKLVALQTTHAKVVAPIDLLPWEEYGFTVSGQDALLEPNELVRLHAIPERKRWLIHKPVVTESGDYLGRLDDYVMDMTTLSLIQLYVVKKFLFLTLEKRIIGWKDILEIRDEAIVVKDQGAGNPETLQDYFRLKKDLRAPQPLTRQQD